MSKEFTLSEHYLQKGDFEFATQEDLLNGANCLVPIFDLPSALSEVNDNLHALGYLAMYPDTLNAVYKQLDTSVDNLISYLVKTGKVQFTPPINTQLKNEISMVVRKVIPISQSHQEAIATGTFMDLGIDPDSNGNFLQSIPIDILTDYIPETEPSIVVNKKDVPYKIVDEEQPQITFQTNTPAIVSALENAGLGHLAKGNGDKWQISCHIEDIRVIIQNENWNLLSNIIRWSGLPEVEFFVEGEQVLITSHEAFLALKQSLEDPIKNQLGEISQFTKKEAISEASQRIVRQHTKYQASCDTLTDIGKIHNCVAELLSISFGGLSPKDAAKEIGVYLYDCLINSKPVIIPYIFSPNYDPSSETELTPTISEYRVQRIETFAAIKTILEKNGLTASFIFLYDDVPSHLEYKPQSYYSENQDELEEIMAESFEGITQICHAILGDSVQVQRLSEAAGFDDYYAQVNFLREYLPNDNGYTKLFSLIVEEDLVSESRHRSNLDEWTCQDQAAKRLAQGWAGVRLCQQLSEDKRCLIVTMETNTMELSFFHNLELYKKLGLPATANEPMIINLQKLVEK